MRRNLLNPMSSSPANMHKDAVVELVRRYNAGELDHLNERDLEKIAILAAQMGIEFDVESKPIRKGLFDLADTAAFGLIPNRFRPTSVGQEFHGESGLDRFAGGVGTVLGAVGTGGALLKGTGLLRQGVANSKMANLNPLRDRVVGKYTDTVNRVTSSDRYGRMVDQYGNIVSRASSKASDAAEFASAGTQSLINRAFRNAPSPRTGSIVDEIFGPRF